MESLDVDKFNNKQIFKLLLNSEENEKQIARVAQQDVLMIYDDPDSDRIQESIDNTQPSKIVIVIKNWSVTSIGIKLGVSNKGIDEAFKLILRNYIFEGETQISKE